MRRNIVSWQLIRRKDDMNVVLGLLLKAGGEPVSSMEKGPRGCGEI